ncbi:E3 ubiquitin-protein ligase TRIM36-like [Saccostrea cucullata]|uniref:E3 ubiquitin-protein ligase TRIM36-like n=1 Tax=Saccostrea cuccullata TaxID=36930 RepID=UPI002ED1E7A3
MATASTFAQHFIECENCEENPAQYFCKTCPGHLCEECKTDHAKKKISQNHDIFHLTSEKGEGMELLYCSEHTTKKLDCYCSPCQMPICIKCLMETHNGHTVENLATVYDIIKGGLEKEREKIDTFLLPKYKEMLSNENAKQAEILKRTAEVQKQIEDHTGKIIEEIEMLKELRVVDLQTKGQRTLKLVENSKQDLEKRIESLENIKTTINNNLGANPGITFFQPLDTNKIKELRTFPRNVEYSLCNFNAGNINTIVQERHFGDWPDFSAAQQIVKSVFDTDSDDEYDLIQ